MTDDAKLLRDYAEHGLEAAFGELVARYVDLVYSTALRQVNGDAHLAQDVTQSVFIDLARGAGVLPTGTVLGGWLYRHTGFTASKVVRGEHRRRIREREAVNMNALHTQPNTDATWRQVAPVLDEAMQRLGARDRDAIVLRYFERRDLRAVGTALGTNEDAVQKRVSRALEKLRAFLARRGITFSAAVLGTTVASQAVTAAPVGLAASVTGAALAGAVAGGGITVTLLKLMSMTKIKAAIVSAIVVAGVAVPIVHQHQTKLKLQEENQVLQTQIAEVNALREENAQLAKLKVDADELDRLRKEHLDLARLRGEVASLRRDLAARKQQTQSAQEEAKPQANAIHDQTQHPYRKSSEDALNSAKFLGLAARLFATDNNDVLPTKLEQIKKHLEELPPDHPSRRYLDEFELVSAPRPLDQANDHDKILFRERFPHRAPDGKWIKVYTFVDGHVQFQVTDDGNFESWEKEHMVQADSK